MLFSLPLDLGTCAFFSELPVVSCCYVFTVKYRADGIMDRYKALLVARDSTQTHGVNYLNNFSHVAHLNSIRVFVLTGC